VALNMGSRVQSAWVVAFTVVSCYAAWLSALFYLSFLQTGSWDWVKEVRRHGEKALASPSCVSCVALTLRS
jgi:hypothetical protein